MMMAPRLSLVTVCAAALACAAAAWPLASDIRAMMEPVPMEAQPVTPAETAGPAADVRIAPDPMPVAIEEFSEILDRPVFAASRRPPDTVAGAAEQAQPLTATLTGILITPGSRMALLSPGKEQKTRRVREGDTVQGWKVTAIEHRRVTFRRDGSDRVLQLRAEPSRPPRQERARRHQNRPEEQATENWTASEQR
jgi:hypothetical protein